MKKLMSFMMLLSITACFVLGGCSKSNDNVVIYTNADEEAIEAMKNALDNNGYGDKYTISTYGTSELGGKLLAEGSNIEADLVTMSSFYLTEAQQNHNMFQDLSFQTETLDTYPSYYTPIVAIEGAINYNTVELKEKNVTVPKSLKDLASPEYEGIISITDITGSSSAWLMIQALVSEYGETQAKEILEGIYKNAGPHLESSGSGPIKKVRTGEVIIGFGLRHQAVADKLNDLPIEYVDPTEGNFSLTESVAVVDKGNKTNSLAMEMAECIIKNGRSELLENYPTPIYSDETVESEYTSAYPKVYSETLTVELLKEHQALSDSCK